MAQQAVVQAFDHYSHLLTIYLSGQVSDDGRRWLYREMAEMEKDMAESGLLKGGACNAG